MEEALSSSSSSSSSSEREQNSEEIMIVKDESDDLEAGSAPCCRICLEFEGDDDDELISPCMCKGTQKFVHRSCLDQWRAVKEGCTFSHCSTCKAQFHLRIESSKDNSWHKGKLRLFAVNDVLFAIAAMGAFAYLMDKDGAFRISFIDGWNRILSKYHIPIYCCLGIVTFFLLLWYCDFIIDVSSRVVCRNNCCDGWRILDRFPGSKEACFAVVFVFVLFFPSFGITYGFVAATMVVQRIWRRHYHFLKRRELTKEYIVEDRHGFYTPPILDAEHEKRLKVLKLL